MTAEKRACIQAYETEFVDPHRLTETVNAIMDDLLSRFTMNGLLANFVHAKPNEVREGYLFRSNGGIP